ncbi:hypothetical protein SAMN05660742_11333 [Propionispira arboris]|uniref:Uncharacterized protein n=1 Tax=Propionispira arboris TaxID=84035 RepID=A0A1H7ALW1_9FIRM|nr:hypothetical protein [Propionispira arboris]SEJ66569.1 hypothetical protein SAMN05660742_11333 [Propionispira arboris]
MELQGKISESFMYTRVGKTLGHFVMIPESGHYQGQTVGVSITEHTKDQNDPMDFKKSLEVTVHTLTVPEEINPEPSTWTADCKYFATAKNCKILVHH